MTETPAPIKTKFERIINALIQASPALIGISFIVSVSYDYYFFGALNLTFADTPTQISDHIRSSIIWIPILGGMYSSTIQIIMAWNDRVLVNIKNDPSKYARFFLPSILYITPIVFIASTIPMALVSFALAIFITAIATISLTKNNPTLHSEYNHILIFAIFISVFIFSISIEGHKSAKLMLNSTNKHITATIKINDVVEELQINGIRRFSEFSIIVDSTKRVLLVPKDSIIKVSYNDDIEESKTLVCFLFEKIC